MTSFWKRPKFIIWTLALILMVIVILQNVEPTQVDFLFWSLPSMPKLVLILVSMALGAILALTGLWEYRHHKKTKQAVSREQSHLPPVH